MCLRVLLMQIYVSSFTQFIFLFTSSIFLQATVWTRCTRTVPAMCLCSCLLYNLCKCRDLIVDWYKLKDVIRFCIYVHACAYMLAQKPLSFSQFFCEFLHTFLDKTHYMSHVQFSQTFGFVVFYCLLEMPLSFQKTKRLGFTYHYFHAVQSH